MLSEPQLVSHLLHGFFWTTGCSLFLLPLPTDKTLQVYKSSTLGQVTNGRSTPARSLDIDVKDIKTGIDSPRTRGSSQAQSWENEGELIY